MAESILLAYNIIISMYSCTRETVAMQGSLILIQLETEVYVENHNVIAH